MGGQIIVGLGVGVTLFMLAQHDLYSTRLIFPFFKQLIPDLGWVYVPFAVLRAGRDVEHREPHRRPRRPRHQRVRGRRRGVHRAGLRHRPPRVRRVSADRALRARGGAHRLLRRAGRREPRLPLVQLVPGGDLHGRRRVARARRRTRHGGAAHQAGAAAAARRRAVRHRGAVGDYPGGLVQAARRSASSAWRRSITTSSWWAGASRR